MKSSARAPHQPFDVQIQQEPDVRYDTLAKLKPFFEKVADSLLKKKKAQIESEMQQQSQPPARILQRPHRPRGA